MAFFEDLLATVILTFQIVILWPWEIVRGFLPKKKKDISNEIVFVTGAGSGIGRLMSTRFAQLGATVLATDLNEETARETAAIIKKNGGKAHSYQLDVTDRAKVYELGDEIRTSVGEVTMLVNNAGIVTGKNFMDCPDALIDKTFQVNTMAHFWTLKAFLGPMIEHNRGHIITIASIAGFAGAPKLVDYVGSKFGAVGIHESIVLELRRLAGNIKLTCVCPWFIKTGMFEGAKSTLPFLLPMLQPEDVVDRIMAGILNDEPYIFIPWRLTFLLVVKSVLPHRISMMVFEWLHLHEAMSGFVGRKKVE